MQMMVMPGLTLMPVSMVASASGLAIFFGRS